MNVASFISTCLAMIFVVSSAANASDPERGKAVYKKCKACHMVGEKAKKRSGPVLNNILNAKAAGSSGFSYSKAMKDAADAGLHWTPENLNAYLLNPKDFIPKTRMSFRGLKSEDDRLDVIAYLSSFSGAEMAEKVDEGFSVSEEILSLEGDVEYGEYLSSECTTCHQSDGDNDGIPGIIGWDEAPFVTAMHAYREKNRTNEVMQLVSGRLSDEEIAALAAYFKGLGG